MPRLLSRILGHNAGTKRRSLQKKRALQLEALEDRRVPATFFVTTFADVVNPNDGVLSLREAINAANVLPGPDTIVLQAGVYKISLTGTDDTNAAGDFDVTHPLTIVGQGAGKTAIDGNNAAMTGGVPERLFEVFGSTDMVFSNLTLRNGGNGQVTGGAVQAQSANVTLNNVVAMGNNGLRGGAINAETGNVTLTNSMLVNNFSQNSGGGIWAGTGNVTLSGSTVVANQGDKGGGIFARNGKVTVTNSTFARNRGDDGGAIFAQTGDIAETGSRLTANTGGDGGAIDDESGNVALVRSLVDRNRASQDGGGIRVPLGTLAIRDSTVRLNVAGQVGDDTNGGVGGGAFAHDANVVNSTVSGNTAFSSAGGLFAAGTAILTNSTVSGNSSVAGGGGLLAAAAFVFSSTVSGNTAGTGAGGGINAATLMLNKSTVSGNTVASGAGGGIRAATATLVGSTVSGNTASAGSGAGINADSVSLTNTTVSGNRATTGNGGGIFASRGTILNSTIVENFAAGNGGGVEWGGGTDHIHVKNTIIADNLTLTIPEVGQDVFGDFVSDGHNLIGVAEGSTGFGAAGDLLGHVGNPLDPRLAPLANNGGPTRTHALLAGSPAIDKGDNAGAPAADQRGVARPRDGDGNGSLIADIGAFER